MKLELNQTIDALEESGVVVAQKSAHIAALQAETKQFWKLADTLEYEFQRIEGFKISTTSVSSNGDTKQSNANKKVLEVNSKIDEAKDLKRSSFYFPLSIIDGQTDNTRHTDRPYRQTRADHADRQAGRHTHQTTQAR